MTIDCSGVPTRLRETTGVRWSALAVDIDSGRVLFELDPDRVCNTASVGKIFMLHRLLTEVDAGRRSLEDRVARRPVEWMDNSGLWYLLQQNDLSLYDLAALIGAVSDNAATNTLVRVIGLDAVQEHTRALGYRHSGLDDCVRWPIPPGSPTTLSHGGAMVGPGGRHRLRKSALRAGSGPGLQYRERRQDLHAAPLLTEVDAGRRSLEDRVARRPVEWMDNSGLWYLLQQNDLSLYDLAALIGAVSDNAATNTLVRVIGLDAVQEHTRALGYRHSGLDDCVRWPIPPGSPTTLSHGTASELVRFCSRLSRGEDLSHSSADVLQRWRGRGWTCRWWPRPFGPGPCRRTTTSIATSRLWNKTARSHRAPTRMVMISLHGSGTRCWRSGHCGQDLRDRGAARCATTHKPSCLLPSCRIGGQEKRARPARGSLTPRGSPEIRNTTQTLQRNGGDCGRLVGAETAGPGHGS
ncbi:MAG: class A beta-lactamase-related serine hydrolase [Acidipropionibacterium sp.]|jgi:hypothetical protein|nr:class A beta-lactamase-related serine hydrolase [Acidipropionibacterium sp.]